MKSAATFSELLQGFFTDRLMGQCNASALTIANYRTPLPPDCLCPAMFEKPPTKLTVQDLNAPFIARFLDYLERERGNSRAAGMFASRPSTRFFNYVALHEPSAGRWPSVSWRSRAKRCREKAGGLFNPRRK